ncbi:MAG: formate dehydrogenase subunit gamma [Rhodoferax sp.]|nr:formate dehydrogenase subunit gamma [Rhodoferax sp.]MDP3655321.1 formate dehydrogenase subunit gamma [Rhodoferax sp.]
MSSVVDGTPPLEQIQALVAAKKHLPGALLPILHDIQDALGHVPAAAVGLIASALHLSRAEVHGVLTFYHHFRTAPAAPTVLQLCRAEACQSMGANRLWAHACDTLALDAAHGGTSADGAITLAPVYCLGLCSTAPALALNEHPHARVDAEQFDRLVAAARSVPCR